MSEINVTNLPATLNHAFVQGDSFTHTIYIKEGGVLVDLTGDEFTFTCKDQRGDLVLSLEVGTGVSIISTGLVQYQISAAQSLAMPTNCNLKYSFRWNDRERTIEVGIIKVAPKV